MPKEPSLSFVVRWAGVYAVTECVVVIVASLTLATSWPWVALVATIEGALLGLAQGWLLRDVRPRFIRDWTLATIAGVLLGRAIEFAGDGSPLAALILTGPFVLQIVAGAALGALVGAAAGSLQAVLLRGSIRRPERWVAVCAVAWSVALPSLLLVGFATGQLSGAVPLWHAVVAILLLFAAIGATTGAIEGGALAAMLRAAGRSDAAHARLCPALEHSA
jgi:uncharacterized membrane protein